MKFKVHEGRESYEQVGGKLLETILKNRGIEDHVHFLNVSVSDINDPYLLKNMEIGIELLRSHEVGKSKIYVEVDDDTDGYTSGAMAVNFLRDIAPNCTVVYNVKDKKQKKHGIVLEMIENDVDLVITPDSSTNDVEECKILSENGINILVLDHHEIEADNPYAVVINCMDGQYPNKSLSGANVTYKFIEAYCNKYHPEYDYTKFLTLVGLANVADAIDLRSYEARQYALMGIEQMEDDKNRIEKGLDIIGNKFIQAIIEKKKDRDLKHINVTSIGWFISPVINGTIRFGEHEEKLDLFRALLNEDDDRIYQPRRKKKEDPKPDEITVSLQEHAVRVCTNAKARQDKTVKKAKDELVAKIEEKGLNENKILMVNATDILEKSLTGLVANKLANDYKKPVLIFKQMNDEVCGGSARNYNLSPIPELKDFLVDLGIFEECLGHQGAFGMKIKIENMLEARDLINEKLKDIEMVDTWVVDYQIPVRRIKEQDILDLGLRREVWGNGVHKPLFAITGVTLQTKDIALLGEKANMISFKVGNLRFIKFFTNVDEYNRMIMRDTGGFSRATPTVNMDLIVEFSVNEYEGRNYPECVIVDYNVSKAVDKMF